MDAVIIYFKRKVEPVKPDPEKAFLMASWAESLKVKLLLLFKIIALCAIILV